MRLDLRFSLALAGWLAACFVGSMGASACSHRAPPPVEPEPPPSAIPAPGPATGADDPAPPPLLGRDRASKLGTEGSGSSGGALKVQSLDAPNENQPSTGPSYVEKKGVVTPPTPSIMNSGGKSTPPPPAPLGN